jgi:hypothetical protein
MERPFQGPAYQRVKWPEHAEIGSTSKPPRDSLGCLEGNPNVRVTFISKVTQREAPCAPRGFRDNRICRAEYFILLFPTEG